MRCWFSRSTSTLALVAATIAAIELPAARQQRSTVSETPVAGYTIVRSYPHDPGAFTQGLLYSDGFLYEGTGLNGQSSIRKVRLETGEVLQVKRLERHYFGEGIVIWNDSLIQLTWQSGVAFVYDRNTFERTGTFTYKGEGWGLTHDGTNLVMSDGTPQLRFLDPKTFKETRRLTVRDGGMPVDEVNELEFIRGEIFANIWNSQRIARISPKTGQVNEWIDLRGLLAPSESAGADVLNGIAYDAKGDRLFVTGKLWPRLFEIRIEPRRSR